MGNVDQFRRYASLMTRPTPRGCTVTPVELGNCRAEWLTWDDTEAEHRIVYFHGGGYVGGSARSYRYFVAQLARESGAAVLNVDYRLAPEDPFPAGQDDAFDAFAYAQTHGPGGASGAKTLFLGGDSAGGGLAISLMLRLRDEGFQQPDGAMVLSPWVDLTNSGPSHEAWEGRDPMLRTSPMKVWERLYAGERALDDPYISPVFGDFTGLAPVYILVGEKEILFSDSIMLGERLRRDGVEAEVDVWPEMMHVWPLFHAFCPEAREALGEIVDWYGRHRPLVGA